MEPKMLEGTHPPDYRDLIKKLRDPDLWYSLTPIERETLADLAARNLTSCTIGSTTLDERRRRLMARAVIILTAIYEHDGEEAALSDVAEIFGVAARTVREAIRQMREEMGAQDWELFEMAQLQIAANVKASRTLSAGRTSPPALS